MHLPVSDRSSLLKKKSVFHFFSSNRHFFFFLLPALALLIVFINLLLIPPDPKNIVFLGFSLNRLILLGISLIGIIFFGSTAAIAKIHAVRANSFIDRNLNKGVIFWGLFYGSLLLFISSWIIAFLPDASWGIYIAYIERFRPHIYWLLFFCFQLNTGLLWWKYHALPPPKQIRFDKLLIHTLLAGAVIIMIWLIIQLTGLGVWPGNAFWGKSGVPLLTIQVFISWLASTAVLQLLLVFKEVQFNRKIWLDMGLSIIVWLLAVVLWSSEPIPPSTFNSIPSPPNYASFPSSDATVYDLSAHSVLMGNKISRAYDKSLYISYLTILNFFTGSDFNQLIRVQIFLLALIPVILYWLGKSIHSPPLGVMIAFVSVFKEMNAIAATNLIQVSNVKMILTEMMTLAGILLFTLVFVRWLKNPSIHRPALFLSGGLLGLAGLIRLNILAAIPLLILVIGWSLKFRLKQWIAASFLFVLFMMVSLTPWVSRNWYNSGNPIGFIRAKTQGVIINQRYEPVLTDTISKDSNYINSADIEEGDQSDTAAATASPINRYINLGRNIAAHFNHNLLGVTFMLPPTPVLYDLYQMIRLPYWDIQWNGALLPGNWLFLVLILGVVAFGIGAAYTHAGAAGIAPLFVMLGYNLSNSLSLTSGARYLVPMDFGVIFYFCIGIMELTWIATLILQGKKAYSLWHNQREQTSQGITSRRNSRWLPSALLIAGVFLSIGSVPVVLENVFTSHVYAEMSEASISNYKAIIIASLSEQNQEIGSLIESEEATWATGRALYPRYYPENVGDIKNDVLMRPYDFARSTFILINQDKKNTIVILPVLNPPDIFPNAADVIVVGCQQKRYLEAIAVIVRADGEYIYLRSSQHPITCLDNQ
jgi:hypothetical protein